MNAWLWVLLLALALGSVADRSGTAWLVVRSIWFAGIMISCRKDPDQLAGAVAFGFAAIAMAGWAGFDFAIAAMAFVLARMPLRLFAGLAIVIGGIASCSLLYSHWNADWTPVLFPFHNRNHYAVFCELTLPVLVYCWQRDDKPWLLWSASVMVVTALAGGSRTGAALLLLEVCALWIALGGRSQLRHAGPVIAIAASVFVFLSTKTRIFDPLAGDHRAEIWRAGLEMIAARPLTGWGAGEFSRIYPAFALFDSGEFVNSAHSDWLEWMVEFGLMTGLAAMGLFLWWLRKWIHFYPSWGILIGALHAAVDYPFHLPGLLVFAAAIAGSIEANGTSIETQSSTRQGRNSGVLATGGPGDLSR
jgi:O-antigen ligase